MYMNPLSFTISDIDGNTVISGGIVNDPSRFENEEDLLDYAFLSCNAPVFHVDYTSYLWNVCDGDAEYPSDDEINAIRKMYEHLDPDLVDHLDFVESGSYEVGNPTLEANE